MFTSIVVISTLALTLAKTSTLTITLTLTMTELHVAISSNLDRRGGLILDNGRVSFKKKYKLAEIIKIVFQNMADNTRSRIKKRVGQKKIPILPETSNVSKMTRSKGRKTEKQREMVSSKNILDKGTVKCSILFEFG